MSEDGLRTGRNMYHTRKGKILFENHLSCVRMHKRGLFKSNLD